MRPHPRLARALHLRRAWRAAGIPALVSAEQARVIARTHDVDLAPAGAHVTLAALAVEITRTERLTA